MGLLIRSLFDLKKDFVIYIYNQSNLRGQMT